MKPILLDPWTAKMITTIVGIFSAILVGTFGFLIRWTVTKFQKSTDANTAAITTLTGVIMEVKIDTAKKLVNHEGRIERVEDEVEKLREKNNSEGL